MGVGEQRGTGSTGEALRIRAAHEQRRARVPSLVLGTARGAEDVRVVATGMADVERGLTAGPGVAYRIGSITKTFTAALVLGLVDDGVLTLADRVEDHLPGTPLGAVTVRELLSHSGGVQREVPGDMWESMRGPDGGELVRRLRDAELVARPGQRWHYSNLGYAMLGQIVERTCGTACPALIDERLIKPLGLTTTVWSRPVEAAAGYRLDPYSERVHLEPEMDQGAVGVGGQLWSTAADLLTWGNALAGGAPAVVAPTVVDAMHTLQVMVDPSSWTLGWGLGLILDRRGDRVSAGHTGAMPGFLAALALDRPSGSVVVALSNASRGAAVGALAGELLDDLIDAVPRPAPADWSPASAVPAEVEELLGRWWSEADETVFTWRDGALHAQLVSASVSTETRFERLGRDAYRAVAGRFIGERMLVRRDATGMVEALVWATYPFTRAPR